MKCEIEGEQLAKCCSMSFLFEDEKAFIGMDSRAELYLLGMQFWFGKYHYYLATLCLPSFSSLSIQVVFRSKFA